MSSLRRFILSRVGGRSQTEAEVDWRNRGGQEITFEDKQC